MKKDEFNKYRLNIEAWDEIADCHLQFKIDRKKRILSDSSYTVLDGNLDKIISSMNLQEKSIIHICCNDGEELISLKKRGAYRCVGIDFSQKFINEAKKLSIDSGYNCEFICSDVYSIPSLNLPKFDICLITSGTLIWFPSLIKLFEIICKHLNDGGQVIISEQHPFTWLFDGDKVTDRYGYFNKGPYEELGDLDYFNNEAYGIKPNFTYNYTLSEVVSSLIENRFNIESFEESNLDISNLHKDSDVATLSNLPFSFTMIAKLKDDK